MLCGVVSLASTNIDCNCPWPSSILLPQSPNPCSYCDFFPPHEHITPYLPLTPSPASAISLNIVSGNLFIAYHHGDLLTIDLALYYLYVFMPYFFCVRCHGSLIVCFRFCCCAAFVSIRASQVLALMEYTIGHIKFSPSPLCELSEKGHVHT